MFLKSNKALHFARWLYLLLFVHLSSCTSPKAKFEWNYSKDEITQAAKASNEKISVDVYMDVTTSMKGFVSPGVTNFSKLLDDVEATCQNVWKETDIQYFKFGRSVVPIKRTDFVSAKNSVAMFSDASLSTQTNFAGAVQNIAADRVSILITDFFYNNNDVNLVVNAIKDSCIKRNANVEIGIIGLSSPFDGLVGDVKPPVKVKGERPLYVLLFGEKQNIARMFTTLKSKPYINGDQLLLISAKPVEQYKVEVKKNRKNKTVNNTQGKLGKLKDYETVFGFSMDAGAKEAELDFSVSLTPTSYITTITTENIKYAVFKKADGQSDSTAADNEIKLTNLQQSSNTITGNLQLNNNEGKGTYSYAVYLSIGNTAQPKLPAWVKEVSTETYAQGINENKTLNLEKLLSNITTVFNTARQPKIAKFFIQLEKK